MRLWLALSAASGSACAQVALIIGNLWFVGDVGIRKRVLTLLHQRSGTLAEVRDVLKELYRNIGDEGRCPEGRSACGWLGEAVWQAYGRGFLRPTLTSNVVMLFRWC